VTGGPAGSHPAGESPAGSVLLDIGGDTGAAVIYVGACREGAEMEIRQPPDPWDGTHTAIRRRQLPAGPTFAAVFESLPSGRYQVRMHDQHNQTLTIDVAGGSVTEAHWPR
jgi:hypothetical protein